MLPSYLHQVSSTKTSLKNAINTRLAPQYSANENSRMRT